MLDILDRFPRPVGESGPGSEGALAPDHVVLLDVRGRPCGTAPKRTVHHATTPLHLAFSCHVIRPDGQTLITRRSGVKATWPGVWTNACCGHPRLGETLRAAVRRHIAAELGCSVGRIAMAIGDFAYRAEMDSGVVEHELCPVVVAELDGPLRLDPAEADASRWLDWSDLHRRAADAPHTLSPWSVAQLSRLPSSAEEVWALLDRGAADGLLDVPFAAGPIFAAPVRRAPRRAARCLGHDGDGGADPVRDVLARVDAVLATALAEWQRRLVAIDASADELGRTVFDLVTSGGKRLRPAFVHWGWRAAEAAVSDADRGAAGPAPDAASASTVGAAMELLHTFALLHDDVMDRAATRRGRPSAHAGFAAAHRVNGGRGDAELFGTSAATLAGDLAFVWADELLDRVEAPAARLAAVRAVFGELRNEVIVGQYLDLLAGSSVAGEGPHSGEHLAVTVARLKSARYTVTRPLELGAALGGLDDEHSPVLAALRTYGDAVGLAFQMRDDVLDLVGDPAATGKGTFGDLREGKRTVLLERALRLAAPADADHLRASIGRSEMSVADAERCRDIIAASGALASVEAMIAVQHHAAVSALDGIVTGDVHDALVSLADLAVARDA